MSKQQREVAIGKSYFICIPCIIHKNKRKKGCLRRISTGLSFLQTFLSFDVPTCSYLEALMCNRIMLSTVTGPGIMCPTTHCSQPKPSHLQQLFLGFQENRPQTHSLLFFPPREQTLMPTPGLPTYMVIIH